MVSESTIRHFEVQVVSTTSTSISTTNFEVDLNLT